LGVFGNPLGIEQIDVGALGASGSSERSPASMAYVDALDAIANKAFPFDPVLLSSALGDETRSNSPPNPGSSFVVSGPAGYPFVWFDPFQADLGGDLPKSPTNLVLSPTSTA